MKAPSIASSTDRLKARHIIYWLVTAFTLLAAIVFLAEEQRLAIRELGKSTVRVVIEQEQLHQNPHQLARALAHFENIGLIQCVKADIRRVSDISWNNFYSTSDRGGCSANKISSLFDRSRNEITLSSPSGIEWFIAYNHRQIYLQDRLSGILLATTATLLFFGLYFARRSFLNRLRLTEARERIAQQFAHDIRSPLAALRVANSAIGDSDNEASELIRSAITKLDQMGKDLLQKGESRSALRPFDLRSTIEDSIRFACSSLEIDRNKVLMSASEHPLTLHRCSEIEVFRVLSNIIRNGLEASHSAGYSNGPLLEVSAKKTNGDQIEVIITDHGPGFDKTVVEQVFRRRRILSTKAGGHGLGLSHAIRYLESIGGIIEIAYTGPRGSQLKSIFPMAQNATVRPHGASP